MGIFSGEKKSEAVLVRAPKEKNPLPHTTTSREKKPSKPNRLLTDIEKMLRELDERG